jgi:hypothetical protein
MNKHQFQYAGIVILGIFCIALIIWFLLSESSPVTSVSTGTTFAVITDTQIPIEIRKSETSYWSSFDVSDTLKPGDMLRSQHAGIIYLNVSDVGYAELVAPVELRLTQSTRVAFEWVLTLGSMRYFYSFDTIDVPNTISTLEGKFIFTSTPSKGKNIKEAIVSHTINDVTVKVLSGSGTWIESNQTALIDSGELLKRNKGSAELFKSDLDTAPSVSTSTVSQSRLLNVTWDVNPLAHVYSVRLMQLLSDTLIHTETISSSTNLSVFNIPTNGTFLVQVSSERIEMGAGQWSTPISHTFD